MSLFMFNSLNLRSAQIPRDWPPIATEVRSLFGVKVLWCPHEKGGSCMEEEDLEPYRRVGDPEMDDLLEKLHREGRPITPGGDLLQLIRNVESGKESSLSVELQKKLCDFMNKYRAVPEWVDVNQLERGRQVFLAYTPALGASLYYRSLVPGFSLPRIAAVILATGYLAPPAKAEQVSARLMDTGGFLSSCMTGYISTLFHDGAGFEAALYVRILHAKVRRALLKSKRWNLTQFGVPINQEDMAATLLAFSMNALLGVEFLAGVQISRQEQLDFLALWRYIGWLLGVHTVVENHMYGETKLRPLDPCGPGWANRDKGDPIEHSRGILTSIIFHLMKPDESSIKVAHHLLSIGRTEEADASMETKRLAWFYFRCLQCRRFVGDPLANALQLPRNSIWWKRVLLYSMSTVYLSLLRIYTLTAMTCLPLRHKMQQWHLKNLTKFHSHWKESHSSRMLRAGGNGENVHESSCCPFAMVAPPT